MRNVHPYRSISQKHVVYRLFMKLWELPGDYYLEMADIAKTVY